MAKYRLREVKRDLLPSKVYFSSSKYTLVAFPGWWGKPDGAKYIFKRQKYTLVSAKYTLLKHETE